MFTRDLAGVFIVPAFDQKTFKSCDGAPSYSCGYNPTVCGSAGTTGGTGFNGRIIDRLALPTQYNAVAAVAKAVAQLAASSTGQTGSYRQNFMSIGVGLDNASSTGAGWTAVSTDKWSIGNPLYLQSTASTWNQYLATATDTGSALATSTGFAFGSAVGLFDLSAAKRYIRICVVPELHSSGCGHEMAVTGDLIFFTPVEAPAPDLINDVVVVVTSACSTST